MSNPAAKPVSTFTLLAVLACICAFLAVAWWTRRPAAPARELAPTGLTADQMWKATPEMRANEAKHLSSYAWIDQSAGTVQLPIDRAMQLTVERYRAKP